MTPEQTHTLMWVIVLVLVPALVSGTGLILLEYRTLRDKYPDNHITPVIRLAFSKQGGVFVVLFVLFALAIGYLGGHLFWVVG